MNNVALQDLQRQVQNNCNISDAQFGGAYSLCGLLLRLRDLYKWESGLQPWQEPEPADLLEWVDARERHWEAIAHNSLQPLRIGDKSYDPFDSATINSLLRPYGLIYGAGYAAAMKPSFFLAELVDSRTAGELHIDMVDRELARDLFVAPAMRQGDQIFARRTAMLFTLWDLIMEMRPSIREAIIFALLQYDLDARKIRSHPKELGTQLYRVAEFELNTWIHHEIGEAREDVFEGFIWHEIVSTYADSPIELFARVIKDLLADTHSEGLLGHIIDNRIKSSLGFYISFMRPFTKVMFPQAAQAFKKFQLQQDWEIIDEARHQAYRNAQKNALALIELHTAGRTKGTEWARQRILADLIEPLGIMQDMEEDD
ncbi:Sfum_1244 family protein [Desulfoferrobacter suflitae]|uniref:Sfum_1244 family protein n=1 Tax=Desulfoferrobacter suflitae TaxID=2865782 RepID=UPI0021648BE9|nr:Sfum_1244 family protein [Desulfoferrobacter suflitae]MCK8602362.1 hypothetical protein [Desulfoferrobacter suflitae]